MIFLNSVSSAAALVFYLPGVCTHTDTEGKQSPEYFLKIEKSTIFNDHPVVKTTSASNTYVNQGELFKRTLGQLNEGNWAQRP